MRYFDRLSSVPRIIQLVVVASLSVIALSVPGSVAQTVVPIEPFSSVELRDGVKAILRHGPTQSVILHKGSRDLAQFTIADGSRLLIDSCKRPCPSRNRLEIEIITPDIAEILIANGCTLQSRGSFPSQAEIGVAVRHGGTIDIRSMAPGKVTASVEHGGRIFVMPQIALSARVANGGAITYWGDATVEKSVRQGGVIEKGAADDADKPLSELLSPLSSSSVPPVPVIPGTPR